MAGYVQAGYVASGYVSEASRGLDFGVTAIVTPGTKRFQVTVDTTGQNWYSYMVEVWRTESALFNVAFPLQANGPNSFTLLDDWEFVDGWESLRHFRRDGIRYVNAAGTQTYVLAAILSSGVPAGFQVRYQQQDGIGTTNALRTGNIDQLIPIYGDASHGNFDYRNWLVCKVQEEGYDQAETVVDDLYGTLEDQLYVIGLTPIPNGIAAQAGITGITITFEPTPVEWPAASGKYFSTTITDTTDTHSGLEIMQYVRSLNDFNLHDMVRPNGTAFKTVNGNFYGDAYLTPAGVRVVKADGTTVHPDFNVFASDDPSITYVPPVTAIIRWTGAEDSTTVIIYNETQADYKLEAGAVIVGAGGYSLSLSLPNANVAVGDTLRLRYAKVGKEPGELFGVMTASGLSFVGTMEIQPVYAVWGTLGIDGTTVTEFTADNINIDFDITTATNTTKKRLGAWWHANLVIPSFLDLFYGALVLEDANSIKQEVTVLDTLIENTSGFPVAFTDNDTRYYRSDFSIPYDTTGAAIFMDYSGRPFVVTTGGSALLADERNKLMGLPEATATASAVGSRVIEAGFSQDDILKLASAVLMGRVTGATGNTIKFIGLDDTTERVIANVDQNGNRQGVTLTP